MPPPRPSSATTERSGRDGGSTDNDPAEEDNAAASLKADSLCQAFEKSCHGIFHEDDFVAFAQKKRGIDVSASRLISRALIPYFLRLDRTHWISRGDFEASGGVGAGVWDGVEAEVARRLGSRPFLSIHAFSDAFYDDLGLFAFEGGSHFWNAYLLSSMARHYGHLVHVTNDDAAAYTTMAVFLPLSVETNKEHGYWFVDYILDCYRLLPGVHPDDPQAAFRYLKDEHIRLQQTQGLMRHITEYLSGGSSSAERY